MSVAKTIFFAGSAFLSLAGLSSLVANERAAWDQEKAKAKVQLVLEVEATGQPWENIPWEMDPEVAAQRAAEEQKPIFVFFFLKKDSGPPEAPC